MGTILGFLVAAFLYLRLTPEAITGNLTWLGLFIAFVALPFLMVTVVANAFTWSPLQKAEEDLTPQVSSIFRKDRLVLLLTYWLPIFAAISLFTGLDLLFFHLFNPHALLIGWVILLGISIDALFLFVRRVFAYLDPFFISHLFTKQGHRAIQNEKELDLCEKIDALSEISLKAIQRKSLSLTNHVNNDLQELLSNFLISAISISHHAQDAETKALGITDRISYTLFFGLQRLEMINDQAVNQRLEPVCSHLLAIVGKITVAAAKYDISMPSYPLQTLGRFALRAQKEGLKEVGGKAICLLVEVAKTILTEIDIKYAELQDPFFTLINQMQEISKEIFRQDKSINIQILKRPFLELKEMFSNEKMAGHPDTKPILGKIDSVLAEFEALEAVMKTIPPIPLV